MFHRSGNLLSFALLLPALAACGSSKPQSHMTHLTAPTPRESMKRLPREDPKAVAKLVIEATMTGKIGTVLDHTYFSSDTERDTVQHILPPTAAMQEVRNAIQSTFRNTDGLGDDPLPGALTAVDNASVRFEPDPPHPTARLIMPPPAIGALTLVAIGDHWKMDYARSQSGPMQALSPADKKALDTLTKQLKTLAADIRAKKFATEKDAADELAFTIDPARRKRAATTQSLAAAKAATQPAGPPREGTDAPAKPGIISTPPPSPLERGGLLPPEIPPKDLPMPPP